MAGKSEVSGEAFYSKASSESRDIFESLRNSPARDRPRSTPRIAAAPKPARVTRHGAKKTQVLSTELTRLSLNLLHTLSLACAGDALVISVPLGEVISSVMDWSCLLSRMQVFTQQNRMELHIAKQ